MKKLVDFYQKNILLATSFIALVLVVVSVLATSVFLTSQRSVSPTAPESRPRALDGNPVPACQFQLTIRALPSASPSPSATPIAQCGSECTADDQCPRNLRCLAVSSNPNGTRYCLNPSCQAEADCICKLASPTPTPSVSPTATPVPQCSSECTTDSQCPGSLRCLAVSNNPNGTRYCLNPSCQAETDCICNPSPTPTPSVSPSPSPSDIGGPTCGSTCTTNNQCASNMICYYGPGATIGLCRNYLCPTSGNCVCASVFTSPSPTPSQTPQVPVTATSWPTVALTVAGVVLLLFSFAIIL